MAQRTSIDLVKGVLLDSYGAREDGTLPSLQPYIDAATLKIDRVRTCAIAKGEALTDEELEMLERLLSAHNYAMVDQTYASKSTNGASGSFHGQTGMYLEATKFGQMALSLDGSGCLWQLAQLPPKRASGGWLGKTVPEQLTYDQRNGGGESG